MVTEDSNRNIHVNGHRREHTATETYLLMVTEDSNTNIHVNGHRRK